MKEKRRMVHGGVMNAKFLPAVSAGLIILLLPVVIIVTGKPALLINALGLTFLFEYIAGVDSINMRPVSGFIVNGEYALCLMALFILSAGFGLSIVFPLTLFIFAAKILVKINGTAGKVFTGLVVNLFCAAIIAVSFYRFDMENPAAYASGYFHINRMMLFISGVMMAAVYLLSRRNNLLFVNSVKRNLRFMVLNSFLLLSRNAAVFILFASGGFLAPPPLSGRSSTAGRISSFLFTFSFFLCAVISFSEGFLALFISAAILLNVVTYMIKYGRMDSHALCKRTFIFERRKKNS